MDYNKMDNKLKTILDQARSSGASKAQLQDIVNKYKNKVVEPKGVKAEQNMDLQSASASTEESSSDSNAANNVFTEVVNTPASEIKKPEFSIPNEEFFNSVSKSIGKYKTIRDGSGKVSAYDPNRQTPTVNPKNGEITIQNNPSAEVSSRLLKKVKEEAGIPDNVVNTLDKGKNKIKYLKEVGDYLHLVSGDFNNKDADQVLEELGIDYKANAESLKKDIDVAAKEMPYYEHKRLTKDPENIDNTITEELFKGVDNYGFDIQDLNNYIDNSSNRIKDLTKSGVINTESVGGKEAIAKEMQVFKNLSNYAIDRSKYLGKMKGVLEYRLNNGEDVSDSISRVDSELQSIKEGVARYTKDNLTNYVDFLEKEQNKVAEKYQEYKKGNVNIVEETLTEVVQGAFGGVEDIIIMLGDGLGADDFAEEARLAKEINNITESNPLLEMWGVGNTIDHKGTKYMVTDEGQIIDLDTKKNITGIANKIGLDVENLKEKASSSGTSETFFSPYNTTVQGGNVLGNLAVQILGTKGIGSVVGTSSKAMIASNMVMTGGMVYTSTYEDTLQQLRDNNISEKDARKYANEIAMATGSVAALTSIISPNQKAQSLFGKDGMKNIVKNALQAEVQGGKKAMFKSIKDATVKALYSGIKEGSEEVVQENLEYVAERLSSSNVNDKIGRDVLEEEIKLKDVIDNSILAFGASSALAGLGSLKESGYSRDRVEMFDLLSQDFASTNSTVKEMTSKKIITESKGQEFMKKLESYTKYSNKLPEGMPVEKTFDMVDLLDKRNKLEERKQKEDKAFHPLIKEKIKEVDVEISTLLNKKLDEENTTTKPQSQSTITESQGQETQKRENTNQITKKEINESEQKETTPKTETTQETRTNPQGESTSTTEDVRESVPEEKGIKSVKASVNNFVSISDRKLALNNLKKDLKSKVTKGILTNAQSQSLIRRAISVDPTKNNQVDSFLKYFEKQMGVASKRSLRKTISSNKRKVRKSGRTKSKSTPQNIKDLARGAGRINDKYLSNSDLKKYNILLESINTTFKSASNKNFKMVNYSETLEALEKLNEKAELNRGIELAASMGIDAKDLSVKEIESLLSSEDVDTHIQSLKDTKREEAKNLLKKQGSYSEVALNSYSNNELTREEKSTLKELKKVNFDSLSPNMIRQYIKIVDNIIINNDFSNAGILKAKVKADKELKGLVKFLNKNKINPRELSTSVETARILGIDVPSGFNMDFIKHLINSMTSLNITMDVIGGSSKIGSILYNKLGFFELSNSKVRADIKKNKFEKGYNELMLSLSKKNKRILDGEQVVRRSILSTLLQSDQGSKESMQYFKDTYIKGSIKNLQGFIKNNQAKQKIELMENILKELEGVNTKEGLINYLKENDSDNFKLLKFASNSFLDHAKQFETNSYLNHGESFDTRTEEDFYLPLTRSGLTNKTMREKVDNARASMNFMSYNSTNPKSGSIFSRKKNARLDKWQTINFNFDSSIMSKYGEQIYDIEATQSILTIQNVLSSSEFIDKFGLGTAQVLQQKAVDKIMVDSGAVMTSTHQHEKVFSKLEQTIRKVGSMIALGGIDQYAKQYPAVVMSASIRLGKDTPLLAKYMFTRKNNIELLNQSSIALRGESNAGTKRVSDDIKYEDLNLGGRTKINALAKMLSKGTGQTLDKARELVMLSLRVGDVNAANSTFLAYYHSHLRSKGIKDSDIDMETEHIKIQEGDKVRKAAQAYAQHMINTTQTSSDLSEGSSLISNPSIATRFLAGVVIPFSSHANNAMIRMMKAGRNITLGKSKAENTAEVIASLSEVMIFHSMKAFILAPATIYLAQMLYGLGEDDDEQLIDWAFQRNKAFSGVAGDISPLPDSFDIDAMNYLGYLENRSKFSDDEDYSFKDYMREVKEIQRGKSKYYDPEEAPFTFYRYGDSDGWDLMSNPTIDIGLYNIPLEQAGKTWEAIDFVLDGKMDRVSKFGKKEEYILDEEHKTFMMFYAIKQLLSTVGAYDATDRRMMEKKYREIVKKSK